MGDGLDPRYIEQEGLYYRLCRKYGETPVGADGWLDVDCEHFKQLKRRDKKTKAEQRIPNEKVIGQFNCGVCDESIAIEYVFCPFCGAKINWLVSQVWREEYK